MEDYIHITLSDSTRGGLWWILNKNENKKHEFFGDVRNFRADLTNGPLDKVDYDIQSRIDWRKELYSKTYNMQFLKETERELLKSYQLELNVSPKDKIVIWHGDNAREQVSLRYLVNRFKDHELYEAPVSSFIKKEKNDSFYFVKSTTECGPCELTEALNNIQKISKSRLNELVFEWNEIKNDTHNLRILKDNKIVGVDDDFFDEYILRSLRENYESIPKIIGDTFSKIREDVCEIFINYRVRVLIKDESVSVEGNIDSIKDFKIKKNEKTHDILRRINSKKIIQNEVFTAVNKKVIDIISKMKKSGISHDIISNVTGLDQELIRKIN